jgi:hypothetical protein
VRWCCRVEDERAHRGGGVAVEHQRLRRTRIVDARERIDLRDRQALGDGVGGGDRGTFVFDPKAGPDIQEALKDGPPRSVW